MSQFSEIMDKLNGIELLYQDVAYKLELIAKRLGILTPVDIESFKAGLNEDLDLEDDEWEVKPMPDVGVPRRYVSYKTKDGEDGRYDSNLLEKKVKEVMAIAQRRNDPWQLYENPDGTIRIMVSGETVAEWNAQHPGPTE